MALRDDLVGLVDEVRDQVIDQEVGMRLRTVATRRRTWSGGQPGSGTPTDTDTPLSPTPKVSEPPARLVAAAPGRYQDGDLLVTRISATYTEADLTGGSLGAGEEFYWLVDGEPYQVVGRPEQRYLEWRVQLRRKQGR